METRKTNFKQVGHHGLSGSGNGGQVVVQRRGKRYYAFVGHMRDMGTSILEVTDASNPTLLTQLGSLPKETHSHKVRVCGDIMLVNNEKPGSPRGPLDTGHTPGLRIYDVKDPASPKEISFFRTGGLGVHRFSVDCERKLAHISAGWDGYLMNIYIIVDFSNPAKPAEVARWWYPGQWTANQERRNWDHDTLLVHHHHPILLDGRAYLGYWDAGGVILDISDISRIKEVGRFPSLSGTTHTVLPVSREIGGMKVAVVFDEHVGHEHDRRKYMYLYDIDDATRPRFLSKFDVPSTITPSEGRFGPHQPIEDPNVPDNIIFAAWFAGGVRAIDISNPSSPKELDHFLPGTPKGQAAIQSNDITSDDRGLIYVIDRLNAGLDILEYNR